jgi:hypothetical protein
MITVDRIDISHYFQYARRIQSVENTYKAYRLEHANAIPAHTAIVNVHPTLDELDMLFGFRRSTMPWACFEAPEAFGEQRRSTFAFDRVCPSLGTMERQKEILGKLRRYVDRDFKDQQSGEDQDQEDKDKDDFFSSFGQKVEKSLLCNCLEEIEKINDFINFVTSRVGQFLQG